MTNKKCITSYDRKNTDWKYINYLEDTIKELKEENKQIKESRHGLIKRNTKLSNDLFWYVEEIEQLKLELQEKENETKRYEKMNANLQHRLMFYKQSLL